MYLSFIHLIQSLILRKDWIDAETEPTYKKKHPSVAGCIMIGSRDHTGGKTTAGRIAGSLEDNTLKDVL